MLFPKLKDDVLNYYKSRMFWAVLVLILFFTGLFFRLFYLQIIKYDYYSSLSDSNRIRIVDVRADRGLILDRDGLIVVKNTPTYELRIVKEDTNDLTKLLNDINAIIPFNIENARKKIKKSYLYESTVILRGLAFEEIAYFLEHSSDYHGVEIDLQSVRSYYDGQALSHILGYMGEVTEEDLASGEYRNDRLIGKSGVEKYYEKQLRGVEGARQVEVDTIGRVHEILNEKPAIAGDNLVLTVDYDLQKYLADNLSDMRASVTVLDIKDNSVLAMFSAPSYDLNEFTPFVTDEDWTALLHDSKKPLLNRNIEGMYPPGSVYKILMAYAGLKENVITPETIFKCFGSYRLNRNFSYYCWKRSGHGETDLRKALAESCDVYFYNLGLLLEIDIIEKYSKMFGLGKKTGIDLPNEKTGLFPSREWKQRTRNESWYPGETVITSIGQGYMTTTPLQIAVMISGVFNGGNIYQPRIVDKIVDAQGKLVEKIEPPLLASYEISPEISSIIMEGLVSAVYEKGGTAPRARNSDVVVGGKTGTAQVVSLKHTEDMEDEEIPEHWRDHAWFSGVYPAENPRYAIVTMIENGGSGGNAANVAGGVIRKMVELGYVE